MTTPTTDVAVRPAAPAPARTPVNVGVPLKGLDEAFRLSQALAMASVLPTSLRGKPSDALAIILYGQEVGLAPMQAIQGIYIVNGRPTLAAQTWLALLRRAGHRAQVLEHTVETCTVELTRGDTGETHRESFTLQEARTAKLTGKDVWASHPKRMLLARAVSNAARFLCPEVAMGFYAEGDDLEEAAPVVTAEQVAVPVTAPQPQEVLAQVEALAAELEAGGLEKAEGELDAVWE